jgi:hypothetical protein
MTNGIEPIASHLRRPGSRLAGSRRFRTRSVASPPLDGAGKYGEVASCKEKNSMMSLNSPVAALLFASCLAIASAQATTETRPLQDDPLVDTRFESCAATRGFALLPYSTPEGGTIRLSDICLDEDNGRIASAETRDGFTLVEKSRNGRAWEVLDSGEDQYTRLRVQLVPDEDTPGCTAEGLYSLAYHIPHAKDLRVDGAMFLHASGYTIPATSAKPMHPKADAVLLSIRHFSQADLPRTAPNHELPPSADMFGTLSFTDTGATFSIVEGGGYTVGEAGGEIALSVDQTGEVRATGHFKAKSQRLAGHEPHEWVSMQAEIPYLRGHILGKDGIQMKSFGVVRGSYVDASGQEHAFHASARLVACFKQPN